jgi:hypothetical protein
LIGKPPLTSVPSAPLEVKVKGSLEGCTVTAGNVVSIVPGSSFSGKLFADGNGCDILGSNNSVTGSVTFKWKADKTTPMLQSTTVVTFASMNGSAYTAPWGSDHTKLVFGNATVSGAFGGATGLVGGMTVVSSQDAGAVLARCATVKGVKELDFGIGQLTLG